MADDNRVFDVAKPGKTAADPTSRPIIVGHGTRMKNDPMVNSGDKPDANVKVNESKTVRDKVIAPIHTEEKAALKPEVTVTEPTQSDSSSESAIVDAVVDQTSAKKKSKNVDENGLTEEDKAKKKHIKSLVNDKKYFLPIGKVTRKKQAQNTLAAVLLVLILLGAAGYYAYTQGYLANIH